MGKSHPSGGLGTIILALLVLWNGEIHAAFNCAQLISNTIDQQIGDRIQQVSWLKRRKFKKRLQEIKSKVEVKVLAACPSLEECSVGEFQTALVSAIETTLPEIEKELPHGQQRKIKRWPRPWAFVLTGGAILINGGIYAALQQLPWEGVSDFILGCVSTVTSVVLYALGSSIFQRVEGWSTVLSWRDGDEGRPEVEAEYEVIYGRTQALLNLLAQSARNNHQLVAGSLDISFGQYISLYMDHGDRALFEIIPKRLANRLGEKLMGYAFAYPDLHLEDDEFTALARMAFTTLCLDKENHPRFMAALWKALDEVNPMISQRPDLKSKFQKIFDRWFTLSP